MCMYMCSSSFDFMISCIYNTMPHFVSLLCSISQPKRSLLWVRSNRMSSSSKLQIIMILGSVRHGRMVDRVAKCVLKATAKHTNSVSVTTLDPLELDPKCELNRQPMHFLPKTEKPPQWMYAASETVSKADGFLVLSPEYNGLMPPALLNMMNSLPPPMFRHRPVGLVTYSMGTTGAMRSLNAVRPYVSELGLLCVPGYVPIPTVHELIDQDGNCASDLVNDNLRKLLRNLEWYSHAIRNHRTAGNKHVD